MNKSNPSIPINLSTSKTITFLMKVLWANIPLLLWHTIKFPNLSMIRRNIHGLCVRRSNLVDLIIWFFFLCLYLPSFKEASLLFVGGTQERCLRYGDGNGSMPEGYKSFVSPPNYLGYIHIYLYVKLHLAGSFCVSECRKKTRWS